ncbi:MAG: phospholipase D family protein [Pirellulales bacterium]|nr:phospholipase D family protein [Pirellulales bacterium]
MKKTIPLALLLALVLAAAYVNNNLRRQRLPEKLPPMEIYFSPKGGCTEAIVQEIDAAKQSILVQAYSFTSDKLSAALVAAHKRGVEVKVILDSEQETANYSEADFLIHAGVPPQIDDKHAIAHNKIMIIDDGTVITGSFNFTKQAEQSNAENLLVIRDKDIAKLYVDNWAAHAAHSRAYEDKAKQDRFNQPARKPPRPRQGNSKTLEKAMKSILN